MYRMSLGFYMSYLGFYRTKAMPLPSLVASLHDVSTFLHEFRRNEMGHAQWVRNPSLCVSYTF